MKRVALFLVLGAAAGLAPRAAHACGGFFCNQVPVDQSGEQILFSIDGNHVTAQIQISYQGAAKDFAWIVPVATKPKISLGTRTVFQQLLPQTAPQFQVLWPPGPGSCGYGGGGGALGGVPPTSAPTPSPAADSGVVVVDQREVGPFNTVVLESHDSQALITWLNDHHFDQPASSLPLIDHYVQAGMLFVAVQLTKDAMSGDIVPIVLDMESDPEACVPLILTRIAAVPDMPIYVFILGQQRAVPRNWFEVEINPKKVDWFSSGRNYRDLATKAIDDGAGHGFITEYAGPSAFMKNALYQPGRWNLDALRAITSPGAFLQAIAQMGLPRDQTMLALLRKYIPLPDSLKNQGISEQQFYNTLAVQPNAYGSAVAAQTFDPIKFVADLQERIIQPLQDTQALFDKQPYLTRLFSTVSPDEMNRDPLFHFNGELKTVSNYHRALATGICNPDGTFGDITLTFENGEQMELKGPVKPFAGQPWTYAAAEPAARRIALIGPTGQPTVYSRAQAQVADMYLNRETPEAVRARQIAGAPDPTPTPTPSPTPTGTTPKTGGGGCAIGGGGGGAAALLLVVAVAVLRRRRKV
jgi:MYXO-CTERM domain-containing protein